MIHRVLQLLGLKLPERTPEPDVVLDLDNVYVQLKLALDKIRSTEIRLDKNPSSLGRIYSFSETMRDFLKSLLEVNRSVKENIHIETGQFFYARQIKHVKLDKFLFVEDGYYVDNASVTLQLVLEQIELYVELMKDAGQAPYGVMEHNHRQLYSYTESLTQFLLAILDHFGD